MDDVQNASYRLRGSPRAGEQRFSRKKAFYTGARRVFKVLGYLIERGDIEELHKVIERQAKQIKSLRGLRPQARRH